jgi:hypothetical protein
MLSHVFRGRFRLLMALAMAIGIVPVASANAAITPSNAGVVANAFGSYVSVANIITIGRTAVAGLSCNVDPATNPMDSNTVATVSLPVIGTLGVLNSEVSAGPATVNNAAGLQSKAKSNLANLNLLGGLISGTLIQSSVVASMDGSGNITFDTSGSTLADLNVAGIKINANAAPNSQIDLNVVGITGRVILNEQTVTSAGRVMTVRAIHIVIDQPDLLRGLLGVKPLTEVIVAQARAGFTDTKTSLDGMAYGSLVKVGGLLRLGPSARVGLPCKGTGGTPVTNTLVSINLPPILNLGVMNTSVNGEAVSNGTSYSESSAEVLNLNLLGLVKADVIKSVAYAEKTNGVVTLATEGPKAGKTQFLTLIVLGNPITINVAPNTKVSIPGLATLWLNRVIKGSDFIEVRGLDLSVLNNNPLGVLLGTTVRLAVAHASVH